MIPRFVGERPITDLPVYPELFAPDWKPKRDFRIARGKKYLAILKGGFAHRHYRGLLSADCEEPNTRESFMHHKYNGLLLADREDPNARGSFRYVR